MAFAGRNMERPEFIGGLAATSIIERDRVMLNGQTAQRAGPAEMPYRVLGKTGEKVS
jgi:hypothetical protein